MSGSPRGRNDRDVNEPPRHTYPPLLRMEGERDGRGLPPLSRGVGDVSDPEVVDYEADQKT
jgi:hypothetical protein